MDLELEWRELAACAARDHQDLFFPVDDRDLAAIRGAKAVCEGCPVSDDCLAFALETGQNDGIWGGLTPRERGRLKRELHRHTRRAS